MLEKVRVSRLPNGSKPLTYAVTDSGEVFLPMVPIVGPARQAVAANTTSASVTFTQPGAPLGMVYSIAITNVTTGTSITASSGSGLGAYVFPVSYGNDYSAVLTGTGTDGQIAKAVAQVSVANYSILAASANPASQYPVSGTTSAVFAFAAPTGGLAPYTYSNPFLVKSDSSTATVSGTAPGNITVSNMVDGDACLVRITVSDVSGQQIQNSGFVAVAKVAPLPAGGTIQLQPTAPSPFVGPAGTTSATVTFTDPTPLVGTTFAIDVKRMEDGATIIPSAGTGLGPYTVPTETQKNYTAVLTADTVDGQSVNSYPAYLSVLPDNNWTLKASLDLTTNITAGTSTISSGTFNILAGDGVTVKAAVNVGSTGTVTSRLLSWAPTTGLQLQVVDNNDATRAVYYCSLALTTLFASVTDWSKPVLLEGLFNNFLIPSDSDGTISGFYLGTSITLATNTIRGGYEQVAAGVYNLYSAGYTGGVPIEVRAPVSDPPTGLTLIQLLIIGNQIYIYAKTNVSGFFGQPIAIPDASTQFSYLTAASTTLTSPYATGLAFGLYSDCKGPITSGCYLLKTQISQYDGGLS